ncbi:hybrid sensor histidine kinase/response regulator [Allorhodopirellula solitaria]|uniref:hybrid sensor histidine kinase/response regulator n=1 Tax=Allorhodopirellula solitaria TaxID=2527987 RepID=UPI001FEC576B|nr:CHASE3 domain-containing protein [Allorhodopirellula solitaria]
MFASVGGRICGPVDADHSEKATVILSLPYRADVNMPESAHHSTRSRRRVRPPHLAEPIAIAVVIAVLVVSGVIALRNFQDLQDNRLMVRHANLVLAALREVENSVMDAESAQRGYLITGNDSYLAPIDEAVIHANESLDRFEQLTRDNPVQQDAVNDLRELVSDRLSELTIVLAVYDEQGLEGASLAVTTDIGKRTMKRIADRADQMRRSQAESLGERELLANHSYQSGRTTSVLSTLIGLILVGGVLYLLQHNRRKAEQATTVLAKTRERLQLALDAAEMGSWNINLAKEHLMGDAQFRNIYGFHAGEVTFQRAIDALHPEDRHGVETAIAAATRPVDPLPYAIEYRVVHDDGTVHWVLAKGAPHFVGSGSKRMLASFDGIISDVTDRKQQEQRLLESEQAALAANQSKSEFLANMSHEIRTPMAAILGYADVLLGHLRDPDNRNCVLVMKRNGQHLLELINDILDLSRIEAGKLDVDLEVVSLPQLVADVQSLMHVRADQKNLPFHAEFCGQVPQEIRTDATRLRQVLINLIGNAIKFTDQGDVTLSVSYDTAERQVSFAVEDTGIGISLEQQQRLFQPFTQGDSSVTRSYGGSGLGLAISQRLVHMLDGEVSMTSQPGSGSTFTVNLPVSEREDVKLVAPDLVSLTGEQDDAPDQDRTLSCNVLVVDDRRDVRHISQHFLEKAGATVDTAEDGRQGVEATIAAREAGTPFDLIVMDMQMPNVDGMQATAQLRSAGIQGPIIALTADAMKGDRERCLAGGCDDYLSKPIDHAHLVAMVAHYTQDVTTTDLQQSRRDRLTRMRANLQGESSR